MSFTSLEKKMRYGGNGRMQLMYILTELNRICIFYQAFLKSINRRENSSSLFRLNGTLNTIKLF